MKLIKTYVNSRDNKVNLIVMYAGKRIMVTTPITSKVKFTGTDVPPSVSGSNAKAAQLRKWYTECEEFILAHKTMPAEQLRKALKAIVDGGNPEDAAGGDTLAALLNRFADTKRAENTKRAYRCTAKNVEAFDSKATLSVTPEWLRRYEAHELTKDRPSQQKDGKGVTRKGRQQNGVAIDLRNIRAVFNWALENGWTSNYPFRTFKIRQEQTRKRNLPIDVMRQVIAHGGRYCDMFALMTYLIGINISDIYYLGKDSIKDGRLEYRRNKTGRLFSIKVEPEAQHIINRYAGEKYLLSFADTCKDYKVFLKHMNDELGGIYKGCTSYWCRHTWASVAASLDIPIETISAALGHSVGASVTNIYIQYDQKKVDEANRKVLDYIKKG